MEETSENPNDKTHHLSTATQPSLRVIGAVAEAMNVDPLDCPPLYEAIDISGLDMLFENREKTNGSITFNYAGYIVTVDSNGDIVVHSREDT